MYSSIVMQGPSCTHERPEVLGVWWIVEGDRGEGIDVWRETICKE